MAASKTAALAITSGILAVGAGIGVANFAYADATPIPSPSGAPSGLPAPDAPGGPADPDQVSPDEVSPDQLSGDDAMLEELSRVLGIDKETLRATLEELRATYGPEWSAAVEEQLDAAVQAGLLSQAEADALRKAIEQSGVNVGTR